jgi:hypothetical protein
VFKSSGSVDAVTPEMPFLPKAWISLHRTKTCTIAMFTMKRRALLA